jgi:hypothetical protein
MKGLLLGSTLGIALLFSGLAPAQTGQMGNKGQAKGPGVSKKAHPHLNAAQGHVGEALNALREAQRLNEFDMAGHAAKAKELLDQADGEIKKAAASANKDEK